MRRILEQRVTIFWHVCVRPTIQAKVHFGVFLFDITLGSHLQLTPGSQKVGYFLLGASTCSNQPIPLLSLDSSQFFSTVAIEISSSISDSGDQSVDLRTSTHTVPTYQRSSELKQQQWHPTLISEREAVPSAAGDQHHLSNRYVDQSSWHPISPPSASSCSRPPTPVRRCHLPRLQPTSTSSSTAPTITRPPSPKRARLQLSMTRPARHQRLVFRPV